MHHCADIYLLQRQTPHVSGVTAPILRNSKNCICYLWYRSWYWYQYFHLPWPDSGWCGRVLRNVHSTKLAHTSPNQATAEVSSGTNTITYTGGSRYSFWNS
jgi:hypothetical protein